MSKAVDYISEFVKIIEHSNIDYHRLTRDLEKVERQILDIEHFIENETFNASQGFYFSGSLKKLKKKRRKIKYELKTLKMLNDTFEKTLNLEFYKKLEKDICNEEERLTYLKENKKYNTRELHNINKENIKEFYNSI